MSNKEIFGLVNPNNICYLNSMLQCLLNIKPLTKYISSNEYERMIGDKKILHSLKTVVDYIQGNSLLLTYEQNKSFQFNSLIKNIFKTFSDFERGVQQDVHEFFLRVIDYLHTNLVLDIKEEVIERVYAIDRSKCIEQYVKHQIDNGRSILSKLFSIQIGSDRECMNCGKKYDTRYENYNHIPLMLPEPEEEEEEIELDDCLGNFFCNESIISDFRCDGCKEKCDIKEVNTMTFTPTYLIFLFKRFKTAEIKNNIMVRCPIRDLDMTRYMTDEHIEINSKFYSDHYSYNLCSTINHYGNLLGGHYTANVKKNGVWYGFNDESVRIIEKEENVINRNAYLLIYERVNVQRPVTVHGAAAIHEPVTFHKKNI